MKAFPYIFFLTLLSILPWSNLLAQTSDEIRAEYRKERRAMMREMMKMLKEEQRGIMKEFGQDMNPFDNIDRLRKKPPVGIRVNQKRESDGSISVLIHMNKKKSNIDISTKDNVITIKSIQGTSTKTSKYQSSYSQSITIPSDYRAKAPEQFSGGIKISLVRKK